MVVLKIGLTEKRMNLTSTKEDLSVKKKVTEKLRAILLLRKES